MSVGKFLVYASLLLFGLIGVAAWMKKEPSPVVSIEVPLSPIEKGESPVEVDRIGALFAFDATRLPFVETLSFTSRVPWQKDRPAWIADYASHYGTSRHFIARSLNGKKDYFSQKVGPGDKFNVFKRDRNLSFHLVIDLSACKMCFYALDGQDRYLLKTYRVGLGRVDPSKSSQTLTPLGKFSLGSKVAIYKPGTLGFFQNRQTEMIRVFGTRWIPFDGDAGKGYGLHGAPWSIDPATGELREEKSRIGKYDSDGCIRLGAEDMEEIFAIVITKPTTVEIVRNLEEAKLPGVAK
jgi:hypothetical protein